jgi:beta-xylosidase
MFATYYWEKTSHRGCTILKSLSPEGPFIEITNGHITPDDWDAIDGTLFIDGEGHPWMVFVHEWTSTADGIGTMAAAQLSEDLTCFVSEPVELFRADSPSWSNHQVTDGCFMYRTKNGTLLMLWSNFDKDGYCVGIARSENGNILGPWTQDDERLFCKQDDGEYDGGHGMIFTDESGQMYFTIHSPNWANETLAERTVFIPIREENNTLVIV